MQRNERGLAPLFLLVMIEKIKVLELINAVLDGSEKFLVNLKITPDNRIYVDIDGDHGVTIDDCIELSRAIEQGLNRDEEDFSLDVSSAGVDQPLKLRRQYVKNVGRTLEVVLHGGHTEVGELTAADEQTFTLHIKGTKREKPRDAQLRYEEVHRATVQVTF